MTSELGAVLGTELGAELGGPLLGDPTELQAEMLRASWTGDPEPAARCLEAQLVSPDSLPACCRDQEEAPVGFWALKELLVVCPTPAVWLPGTSLPSPDHTPEQYCVQAHLASLPRFWVLSGDGGLAPCSGCGRSHHHACVPKVCSSAVSAAAQTGTRWTQR